jgi:tRNA/rRNA methyltransferase
LEALLINVVLVSPEGEENIGSIARAMMNMDADKLVLVNPLGSHLSQKALNYAVHAADILEKAEVFLTLEEAVAGSDLTVAVSRRVGQWRKRDFILEDFAEFSMDYREKNVSLVFGREKSGLTNEEINLCDVVCSIPSSDKFPSINLAQAVMITLYEIYKTRIKENKGNGSKIIAPRELFDQMMEQIIQAFDEMNYFKNVPKWRLSNYLKKILIRAGLDEYDAIVIKNVFNRIAGIVKRMKKDSNNNVDSSQKL